MFKLTSTRGFPVGLYGTVSGNWRGHEYAKLGGTVRRILERRDSRRRACYICWANFSSVNFLSLFSRNVQKLIGEVVFFSGKYVVGQVHVRQQSHTAMKTQGSRNISFRPPLSRYRAKPNARAMTFFIWPWSFLKEKVIYCLYILSSLW
jgi:hypothetical protein